MKKFILSAILVAVSPFITDVAQAQMTPYYTNGGNFRHEF